MSSKIELLTDKELEVRFNFLIFQISKINEEILNRKQNNFFIIKELDKINKKLSNYDDKSILSNLDNKSVLSNLDNKSVPFNLDNKSVLSNLDDKSILSNLDNNNPKTHRKIKIKIIKKNNV